MAKPRRKRPTLKEQLAAALLTMVRETTDGRWEPCIPLIEAKGMTTTQILARFECDHGVYVAWGGGNHPTNLTFRLKEAHKIKTKRDVKAIAKLRRGLKKRREATTVAAIVAIPFEPPPPRKTAKPKRIMPYTAAKATHKRTMQGKTVRRS